MGNLNIDKDTIRELAELLEETGLTEIEIEIDGQRIRVGRGAAPAAQPLAVSQPLPQAPPIATEGTDASAHPGAVTSPMVGTVYVSPEPGAAPFVKVGDTVSADQTLFIIEAMKTMNPVVAPRGGTVKEIFVSDGQPVEYGEALLILE